MLWLALIHGANGMRTIVNDYVTTAALAASWCGRCGCRPVSSSSSARSVVFTFDPCIGIENSTTDWLIEMCAAQ